MSENNAMYLTILIVSLAFCIWGIISINNVKPINPLEKITRCECVTECLRDYEKSGTVNFFTMKAHRSFNFESRSCESINQTVKNICCREN